MSFYRIRGGTPINDEKSQQRITDPNLLAALADINERFRIKREVQRQDAIDQANANYQPPLYIRTPEREDSPPDGDLPTPSSSPPLAYLRSLRSQTPDTADFFSTGPAVDVAPPQLSPKPTPQLLRQHNEQSSNTTRSTRSKTSPQTTFVELDNSSRRSRITTFRSPNTSRSSMILAQVETILSSVLHLKHRNRDRCEPAPDFDGGDIPSRETTPAGTEEDASKIHSTFDKKPKNLEKGFVFGSDPKTCNVSLSAWAAGFTGQHFLITFNERGEVILTDISQEVTCVSVNGEDLPSRNQFTWILFDDHKNITVTLNKAKDMGKKNNTELVFKVTGQKTASLVWFRINHTATPTSKNAGKRLR
ncbi:MAG: hypothetical protein Q9188_003355 [Gyalolechia gomerana]